MPTKYAQARDVAYQWRAEFRKVRRENRSLRDVYAAARELTKAMDEGRDHRPALYALRDAMGKAVFAVPQEP